eukprot:gene40025-48764_t
MINSLPAIDLEYDHPEVRERVQRLIQDEMNTMTPEDYLAQIPGLYSSDRLEQVMKRVEKACALAISRPAPNDAPTAPDAALASDLQAWKNAVSSAKTLYVSQHVYLDRLEGLLEDGQAMGQDFRSANQQLERLLEKSRKVLQAKTREFHDVQRQRQQLQARALTQIQKYQARVRDSLVRRALCEAKYEEVRLLLLKRGVVYGAEAQAEGPEAFNVEVSLTEREYANVHVSGEEQEEIAAENNAEQSQVGQAEGNAPAEAMLPPASERAQEKEELEEVGPAANTEPPVQQSDEKITSPGKDVAASDDVADSPEPAEAAVKQRAGRKRKSSPPAAEPLARKSSRRK